MKYFGRFMFVTLCLGVVAFVLSSLPSHPAAAAGSAPVTVVNTSPIAVSGTVTATIPNPLPVQPVKQSTANYVSIYCRSENLYLDCIYSAAPPRPPRFWAEPSSPSQPAINS